MSKRLKLKIKKIYAQSPPTKEVMIENPDE